MRPPCMSNGHERWGALLTRLSLVRVSSFHCLSLGMRTRTFVYNKLISRRSLCGCRNVGGGLLCDLGAGSSRQPHYRTAGELVDRRRPYRSIQPTTVAGTPGCRRGFVRRSAFHFMAELLIVHAIGSLLISSALSPLAPLSPRPPVTTLCILPALVKDPGNPIFVGAGDHEWP